jgi:hypothetical protein
MAWASIWFYWLRLKSQRKCGTEQYAHKNFYHPCPFCLRPWRDTKAYGKVSLKTTRGRAQWDGKSSRQVNICSRFLGLCSDTAFYFFGILQAANTPAVPSGLPSAHSIMHVYMWLRSTGHSQCASSDLHAHKHSFMSLWFIYWRCQQLGLYTIAICLLIHYFEVRHLRCVSDDRIIAFSTLWHRTQNTRHNRLHVSAWVSHHQDCN